MSVVYQVYKNSDDRSSSSQYRISPLSATKKHFESNKMLINHINRNHPLTDKQYRFCSSRATADVLNFITHRISEAHDINSIPRAIALDISEFFDNVQHSGLLHNFPTYGILERGFSIIKSFLSGMPMKAVVNGQSYYAREIMQLVMTHLSPNLFLLYTRISKTLSACSP